MNHAVLKDIQAKARNFPHPINSGRSHQSKSGGSIAKADWSTAIAEGCTSVIVMAVQITKADASITETKQKPHHHYKSKRMYHSRRSTAYVIFSIYHYFFLIFCLMKYAITLSCHCFTIVVYFWCVWHML